jgi:hypothetical protein
MKMMRCLFVPGFCLLYSAALAVEYTWKYTVQISATVQGEPAPRIRLNWPHDPLGADGYTVYRKARDAGSWDEGVALSGSATNYIDTSVEAGRAYEYQIVKAATEGHAGYGYIYSGIDVPMIEARGKLVLVVATNSTAGLSNELNRLKQDLVGDGWIVLRRDVSSNATPQSVRAEIVNCYQDDPENVKALFLFGHVPVFKCGPNLNYDGHLARRMPADAYYGDMDGMWSDATEFLPSDVELMVGRVDLFDMPGTGALNPWPGETELLRNYLNKDHDWRQGRINVPRLALMGDRRGEENGFASAASGYRNFQPLVGPGNTVHANTDDLASDDQRWISMASAGSYLWAFGCGGGLNNPSGISQLGTHGPFHDLWSADVVDLDARVVFSMYFGSWFGEWDGRDNFLRSFLATPSLGLVSFMGARPHWFVHHFGLGETIGHSARLSMNNDVLYRHQVNEMTRAVYVALMGDPTLRMDPSPPPAGLTASANDGSVSLSWTEASGPPLGYHVYRSDSPDGPFARLTGSLIVGTNFADAEAPSGKSAYMVRAVKRQQTPGGTYFNPSQGAFASVNVVPSPHVAAELAPDGLLLNWSSAPGAIYRVESKSSLAELEWTPVSDAMMATEGTSTWLDTNGSSGFQRFYRIASEPFQ